MSRFDDWDSVPVAGFGLRDQFIFFEGHTIYLGNVNSRKAMNLSKEQLHENLMRIIFFMKSKEFDKGDLHHLILRASFNENSNEKSIRVSAIFDAREKIKSNEEKIWLDRTDIVRRKVNDVFGEDWVVPEIKCRTQIIITEAYGG